MDGNWKLHFIADASEYYRSSRGAKILGTVGILGLLCIGVLVSFVFSLRIYEPILRTMRAISTRDPLDGRTGLAGPYGELRYIEESVSSILRMDDEIHAKLRLAFPMVRKHAILRLLRDSEVPEAIEEARSSGLDLSREYYCVALCAFKGAPLSEIRQPIIRPDTEDIAAYAVEVDSQKAAILFNLSPSAMEWFSTTAESCARSFSETTSGDERNPDGIAFGTVREGFPGIRQSFEEAVAAMEYRILDRRPVLRFGDIERFKSEYMFPTEVRDALINALKVGDRELTNRAVEKLFAANTEGRGLTPRLVRYFFFELATAIVTAAVELGADLSTIGSACTDPIDELINSASLEQAWRLVRELCDDLCSYANQHKRSHNEELKRSIAVKIDQNLLDPLFSQTRLAAMLGISPSYLSSFFKEQFAVKMTEYVTCKRLDLAKKYLDNTNMTIKEIAYAVGYQNDVTLIRLFKKHEATTPQRYRTRVAVEKVELEK